MDSLTVVMRDPPSPGDYDRPMDPLNAIIARAMSDAKLSPNLAARMIGVNEPRMVALANGTAIPEPSELDAIAQLFGTSVQDFQAGEAAGSPLRDLFYRTESEGCGLARDAMVDLGVHRVMGEFVRCVRDASALTRVLGDAAPADLPVPPAALLSMLSARPPHGGDQLAEWFRNEMQFGSKPIESLRQVAENLGIRLFWVTPEELAAAVEGASACDPTPAILVNLVEGPACWWRTRMTIGHELCHLLADRLTKAGRFAMLTPDERETGGRWRMYQEFEAIERRARAFSACLLAPAEAVMKVVGPHDPTSEDAITRVGSEFGIGRLTAINRLDTVFRFGKATRAALLARAAQHWRWPENHPDRITAGIGLRAGVIKSLAERAFVLNKLDAFRVRQYLSIPLTEPLPSDWAVDPNRLAALRNPEQRVRGIAQQYLLEEVDSEESLESHDCEPSDGGWRVVLVNRGGEPRGHIWVSYELDRVEAHLTAVA